MTHSITGIVTMIGIDISITDMATVVGSCQEPCLCAIQNPSGSPMVRLTIIAAAFTWKETHIFRARSDPTDRPGNAKLSPKSPCRTPHMYVPY